MNTNDPRFELIRRCRDGEASTEELAQLESCLREDVDFRQSYVRYFNLDVALIAVAKAVPKPETIVTSSLPRRNAWLSWRPLTAAAAGVVFGLFCASVAWAYTSPRVVAEVRKLAALVDGSFENQPGHVAAGFPLEAGVWSGDVAEVASIGATAKDGKQMLRFLKADREPNSPNSPTNACDVYQIVDLRPLRERQKDAADSTLELSAEFLDTRTVVSAPVIFRCNIYLFHGSADSLHTRWPEVASEALGTGSAYVLGSGSSDGGKWNKITARCVLPPDADFCVLRLSAGRDAFNDDPVPELGMQFADDVKLILKSQPVLPVHTVQH